MSDRAGERGVASGSSPSRRSQVNPLHVSELKPEHVVEMPHWGTFSTPLGYDYLRRGRSQVVGYHVFRVILDVVAFVVTRLFLGFRLRGRENVRALRGGFVSVCNHVQTLDCGMVLQALRGHRVYLLSIESNFSIALSGQFVRWGGAVPLSPNHRQLHELVMAMGDALEHGDVVHVYPETALVPYHRDLRPFATGAFNLAVRNHVPVLPMVIIQRERRGLWRVLKRKPCLTLTCLPAIYPDESLGRVDATYDLAERCWQAMDAALREGADEG